MNFDSIRVDPGERAFEGVGRNVAESIEILSGVGLGEAYLFLRRYSEMSDGQNFRYRMAKTLTKNPKTLIMDEYCSNLDRTKAKVLAFLTQRWCRRRGITLVVATAHDDLVEDLGPDVLVVKRFGSSAEVRYDLPRPEKCSLMKLLRIEKGTIDDYTALRELHYRNRHPGMVRAIYRAVVGEELAGVIVYASPHPVLRPRNAALPFLRDMMREGMRSYLRWIDEHFVRISRVIVYPKFRGIGVVVELVRQTLPLEGRPYVETLAVMARYNPFFERAGMVRIAAEADLEKRRALEAAYRKLEELGAREDVLLDPELFRLWYRGLSWREKGEVRDSLRIVGEYWRRKEGQRRIPLARAASRLVMLLNPPEYLIWKNPDPEYSGYPEPLAAVTSLPSRRLSS